jgi:hypothetical protein
MKYLPAFIARRFGTGLTMIFPAKKRNTFLLAQEKFVIISIYPNGLDGERVDLQNG